MILHQCHPPPPPLPAPPNPPTTFYGICTAGDRLQQIHAPLMVWVGEIGRVANLRPVDAALFRCKPNLFEGLEGSTRVFKSSLPCKKPTDWYITFC